MTRRQIEDQTASSFSYSYRPATESAAYDGVLGDLCDAAPTGYDVYGTLDGADFWISWTESEAEAAARVAGLNAEEDGTIYASGPREEDF